MDITQTIPMVNKKHPRVATPAIKKHDFSVKFFHQLKPVSLLLVHDDESGGLPTPSKLRVNSLTLRQTLIMEQS